MIAPRQTHFILGLICGAVLCIIIEDFFHEDLVLQPKLHRALGLKPSDRLSSSARLAPKSDDFHVRRVLSVELPGGDCRWLNPKDANQDPNVDLFSTVLAGYPGAGKRFAFMQLEGLT